MVWNRLIDAFTEFMLAITGGQDPISKIGSWPLFKAGLILVGPAVAAVLVVGYVVLQVTLSGYSEAISQLGSRLGDGLNGIQTEIVQLRAEMSSANGETGRRLDAGFKEVRQEIRSLNERIVAAIEKGASIKVELKGDLRPIEAAVAKNEQQIIGLENIVEARFDELRSDILASGKQRVSLVEAMDRLVSRMDALGQRIDALIREQPR